MTFLERTLLASALVISGTAGSGSAQLADKKVLTLDGAKKVAAAAATEARQHDEGAAIAIVDDGGNLMHLERLDGTFAAGPRISMGKARTAALFKKPTAAFEEIIRNGRTPMIALEDFTPLQSGVPIEVDGKVVGAIGVSGAANQQRDEDVAKAGAAALK
jgi:glc operon protein GlcG